MMTEDELVTDLDKEAEAAKGYCVEYVGRQRAKNIDYYLRRSRGDEVDGRSKVVSSDVADVVDTLLPQIMDVFTSTEDAVEFAPKQSAHEQQAKQTTQSVNHVFNVQNNGYLLHHETIKDGLLQKTGYVKWWWEKQTKIKHETYKGLTDQEYKFLKTSKDFEILEETPTQSMQQGPQGPMPVTVFDVVGRMKKESAQVRIASVPPEEILVSPQARSPLIQDAPYVRHIAPYTKEELVAMGYDEEKIDIALKSTEDPRFSEEYLARKQDTGSKDEISIPMYWLEEHFKAIDFDGDGIAELRRVCKINKVVFANEIVEEIPIASWTPKPLPHEFFGLCPADEAMEFQDLNTTILRQTLDSLYQSVSPRWKVLKDTGVNMNDLLTVRPGGIVRMDRLDGATPLDLPFVGQASFPMLQYLDGKRAERTGVSKFDQPLDPNALAKTATEAKMVSSAGQVRNRLIAKNYAEMLLVPLFKGIQRLLAQNQTDPMTLRLTGQDAAVDPRAWSNEYDLAVNIGLGTGSRDQQLAHLTQIAQMQAQAMASGGKGVLVTPENIYNTMTKIAENAGFKTPALFWTDPKGKPPPRENPPPQVMVKQMEMQGEQQKFQAEAQQDAQRFQAEAANDAQKMQAQQAFEMAKLDKQLQAAAVTAQAEITSRERIKLYELAAGAVAAQFTGLRNIDDSSRVDQAGQAAGPESIAQMSSMIQGIAGGMQP